MAKTASTKDTTSEATEPTTFPMTAEEFCADKSAVDKRVELIGGFYHFVTVTKKVRKATRAVFEKYFQEFLTRPA